MSEVCALHREVYSILITGSCRVGTKRFVHLQTEILQLKTEHRHTNIVDTIEYDANE